MKRTPRRRQRRRVAALGAGLAAVLVLAACGGSGGGGSSSAAAPTKTCDQVDLTKAPAKPVTIRLGHGQAAEEPVYLLKANSKLNKYQGSFYNLDFQSFESTETRLVAYQSGKLDAVSVAPQVLVTGTARGSLDLVSLVTIMREAEAGSFGTTFIAKDGSGIDKVADLKGKKIGILGLNTDPDYLARLAVKKAGLDVQTGAQYIVVPYPTQEAALRNGQIDVAGLAEPFYTVAMAKGGLHDVFTARDATGFGFDLLTLGVDRKFLGANVEAACALRADFQAQMAYYIQNRNEARTLLAGTEFVKTPLPVYLQTKDYARPAKGEFDAPGFERLIETSIDTGVFRPTDKIDVKKLYVPGVTAGVSTK